MVENDGGTGRFVRDKCVPCPGVTCRCSEPLYNRSLALRPERDEAVEQRTLSIRIWWRSEALVWSRISGIGAPVSASHARISRANGAMTSSPHTKPFARNREIH